ncbi:glycosyltransferase family 2 protein [Seonamhaeicola sediminis]|uniref:Glycosyltransferase family 2 protein n=1 Tax=Seonamhaeicola sediminis TaxID=2528206 RepID=A0A562YGT4_9FLAO|nr:glycosyltransferase family 2 protein [Seonamhaeicola sediminis]TWO33981.1 glycosyltransferase family 2 protein [Seonamhaeicola sediminis]
MNINLGIIIVNFNSGSILNNCVNSIFRSDLNEINLTVVIVDNDSKDDSLNLDKVGDDRLIILRNRENKGFGFACNQGAELLKKSTHLLFLNPDTEVQENTFQESIKFLNKNSEVSILGTMHRNENGKIQISCSNTPTPIRIFWDILGLSKVFPKIFTPATLMTNFDHKSSRFVDQVMGAYMLMERSVFEKLNGFDTRFFVYYEDADFGLRSRKIGLKSYYNSDIEILHHGRGTTKGISHIALFYNLRSRVQFIHKHYGYFWGIIIQILTFIVEPITRVLFNLIKNPTENRNTVKAFKMLYKYKFNNG